MQQWFVQKKSYTYNYKIPVIKQHKPLKLLKKKNMVVLKTFTVEADTLAGQYICVTGNCSTLGNWEVNNAFVLTNTNVTHIKNNRTYYIWSGKVHLPAEKEIFFRYFVAYIIEPDGKYMKQKQISVHSWESHYEPRTTKLINESKGNSQLDTYGLNNKEHINRGFLTTEYSVEFKLYDTPIKFWNSKLQSRIDLVSIKLTPVPLIRLSDDCGDATNSFLFEDSNSISDDDQKNVGWPFVECVDIPGNYKFQPQNHFGTIIKDNTFHLFQTRVHNFPHIGFIFDIYIHKENSEEPPYHIGFTHIVPSNMKYSNEVIVCPITSVRHKPIGELKIDYLIIKPTKDISCNLEKIKITDWKNSYVSLDIGHRGSGSTFKNLVSNCSQVRENTIASLKEAAYKGADFVEFDVQLTKDLVPIIFHDFMVSLATKSKTNLLADDVEMVQIPLKDFSFEQLDKLKIYHVNEPYILPKDHFLNDVRNDYQPFPKLEKALLDVDINVGFNVELKWTMKLQDGTFELNNPFDMNLFVDIIIHTIFKFAGSRSIVFSCFHPDVCTMLKMKQNRYPVLFLTQGVTKKYPSYDDPRCHTIQTAVFHSSCHDFLGVNAHSEDLLRDHTQINMVKEAGLALFCWGDDNNCKDVVKKFKDLGVNAIIYDKLDKKELLKKKQSCSAENESDVFITNDFCDQNEIILSNKQSLKEDLHLREDNDEIKDGNRYFMDVGKASFQNDCSSTDTLWNDKCHSINNFMPPSKKQKNYCFDQTSESDGKSTEYKESEFDV